MFRYWKAHSQLNALLVAAVNNEQRTWEGAGEREMNTPESPNARFGLLLEQSGGEVEEKSDLSLKLIVGYRISLYYKGRFMLYDAFLCHVIAVEWANNLSGVYFVSSAAYGQLTCREGSRTQPQMSWV